MRNEPHKWRWYQFSLRTLLTAVTLFVVLLGGGFAIWRLGDELPPANTTDPGVVARAGTRPLHEQRTEAARKAFEDIEIGHL